MFAWTAAAPPPHLSVIYSNSLIHDTWPSPSTGFRLETTTNLHPLIQWDTVTNALFDNGTWKTHIQTNFPGDPTHFFRLNKP